MNGVGVVMLLSFFCVHFLAAVALNRGKTFFFVALARFG